MNVVNIFPETFLFFIFFYVHFKAELYPKLANYRYFYVFLPVFFTIFWHYSPVGIAKKMRFLSNER